MVSAIVTWYPPGTGTADTILFVVRPVAPLTPAVVWYTQVSPTVTGNGIDRGATFEFEVALESVPVPGAALEAREAAPVEAAADAPVPMLTSGVLALPDPPHPARTVMAAPARNARTGTYLLM
jgi:hypothetical protein